MKVLLVLGRYGDLYMTLKQITEPCIVACYSEFSQIVYELFPQHIVYEMPKVANRNEAYSMCCKKFPDYIVFHAQQDGARLEEYVGFRNYQSFQIFYANQLQESGSIS